MYGLQFTMEDLLPKAKGRIMVEEREGVKKPFVEFCVTARSSTDEFGYDGTAYLKQTDAERKEKAKKIYFGNTRWVPYKDAASDPRPDGVVYDVKLYLDDIKPRIVVGEKTGKHYASICITENEKGKPYIFASQTEEEKEAGADKIYPGFASKRSYAVVANDDYVFDIFGIDLNAAPQAPAQQASEQSFYNPDPNSVDDLPF